MIALAVYLNRKKLVVAGAEDLHVLHATINAVGKLGRSAVEVGMQRAPDLFMYVGGLTGRSGGAEDEHLGWVNHKRLRVGDKITVQLVRTDRPDTHLTSKVAIRNRPRAKQGRGRKTVRPKGAA
jgi:hypothetical protein